MNINLLPPLTRLSLPQSVKKYTQRRSNSSSKQRVDTSSSSWQSCWTASSILNRHLQLHQTCLGRPERG